MSEALASEIRDLRGEVRDMTEAFGELKAGVDNLAQGVGAALADGTHARRDVAKLESRVGIVETRCTERACQGERRWKILAVCAALLGASGWVYQAFAAHPAQQVQPLEKKTAGW